MNDLKYIWLNGEKFPDYQNTFCTVFADKENYKFAVAGFKKEHVLNKMVRNIKIKIFADTKFWLNVDGKYTGTGPVCAGGDYGNKKAMPVQYYNCYTIDTTQNAVDFYVQVQLSPGVQCDTSCGKGGLLMEHTFSYADGTSEVFHTDETWYCRLERQYVDLYHTDFLKIPSEWENASYTKSVWNLKQSLIPNLAEEKIYPLKIKKSSDDLTDVEFNKIYAGYFCLNIEAGSEFEILLETYETKTKKCNEYFIKGNTV